MSQTLSCTALAAELLERHPAHALDAAGGVCASAGSAAAKAIAKQTARRGLRNIGFPFLGKAAVQKGYTAKQQVVKLSRALALPRNRGREATST